MNRTLRVIYVVSLLVTPALANQMARAQTPPARSTVLDARSQAEIEKIYAERDKFRAEEAYFKRSQYFNLGQNFAGFLAIAISVWLAGKQIAAQQKVQTKQAEDAAKLQDHRARVDALLKAAELAIDAPTSGQVRSRAKILSSLLSELVPDFGKKLDALDFSKIGFASYRARFMSLFAAMANSPSEAALLAESYNLLFPNDDEMSHGCVQKL